MALLDRAGFRAVVYVNNGWTNFQALSFQRAVHVHVNHGESDKICMVSNQAKAYDKVFVAGQAAVDRHRAAIAWFDSSHLVRVGRPQLDLDVEPALPESTRTTYTYAPTWEGEDDANNYSSVDCYGLQIIEALLAQSDARVVYKPYPRVIASEVPGIRDGHQRIVRAVEEAAKVEPSAGHVVLLEADMLGVIRSTDILVADVSSVTLDFLYLRPGAPIILTDRRSNPDALRAESPLAEAAYLVDSKNIAALADELPVIASDDNQAQARIEMRHHYFDDLAPGESTERFWTEMHRAMDEHDTALRALTRTRVVSEGMS
jgi:CDP-glycerol glycerophosphotransferase (TagB/SpsB family)